MNSKITLIILFVICFIQTLRGQDLKNSFVSNNDVFGQIYIYATTVDDTGNLYQTGYLSGTCNVAIDGGSAKTLTQNGGATDLFLIKYNSSGKLIWAKNIGGTGSDFSARICLDRNNNILVNGTFSESMMIDSSNQASKVTSQGYGDIFLLKLKNNGDFIWIKTWGNDGDDQAYGMDVSSQNNIVILGNHNFDIDLDPGPSNRIVSGVQARNSFMVVLDQNGNYQWSKHLAASKDNHLIYARFDQNDNLYVVGSYSNNCKLNFNNPNDSSAARGLSASMVLKFDPTGKQVWYKTIDGSQTEEVRRIDFNPKNELIIAGRFNGSIIWSAKDSFISKGNDDLFIALCNSDGQTIWNKQIGSMKLDRLVTIAVDQSSNVWTVGSYGESCDLNPGPQIFNLGFAGISDGFVSKLNYLGEFVGAISISSSRDDIVTTINTLKNGVVFCGIMGDSVKFKLANSTHALKSKNGNSQSFIVQVNETALNTNSVYEQTTLNIYPNPFNNLISINDRLVKEIELFDFNGKLIGTYSPDKNVDIWTIDTSKLPNSLYILKIKTEAGVIVYTKMAKTS